MNTQSVPSPDATHGECVAIVGLGYVGLPTALAFAAASNQVIGLDVSTKRIADIERGNVDLLASDHDRLRTHRNTPALTLTRFPAAIAQAGTVIVCVPTPVDKHLVPDLTALRAACRTVVDEAVPGQLILLTSTTYVGTTRDLLIKPLEERGFEVGRDVFVAFAPERIDPGNSVYPQERTPRVVGGVTAACTARATAVLSLVTPSIHQVESPETAEMTKLLENTFRAVNIALANEFADASRSMGIDIMEVIAAAATKPYGFMPFYPGPGVGGHCIPCDPHYLLWQMRGERRTAPLVESAMSLIAGRPRQVVERAREVLAERGQPMKGSRVLVVGVTYKPDVADVRESPALEIIEELLASGVQVAYQDELVDELTVHGRRMRTETDPAATTWDLVLVHTAHPDADLTWLAGQPAVLDTTYRLPGFPTRRTL
ncbi:nucleotide sugar dehydrogenase [Actinoplanes sp. NBRC 101535]|uniref:nucleotide sugar dehydrogenase n=1 Tax=Actinoplanes sp. NBRC 101535 TaxID=3032196 RepID=UPI002556ECDD|nr:nucleotide sugar dehydrogenase [Actinoplanes sp. NBRC 101535]